MVGLLSKIDARWGWLALSTYFAVTGLWAPDVSYKVGLLYWGIDVLRFWIIPFAMLLLANRLSRDEPKKETPTLSTERFSDAEKVARFIGGVLLCYFSISLCSRIFSAIAGPILHTTFGIPNGHDTLAAMRSRYMGLERGLVVFYLSLTAAVLEEVFYRGLANQLAGVFKRASINRTVYYLIGVGLFSAYHWPSGAYSIGNAMGIGLVSCIMYRATGKLSIVVVSHFLLDFYILI